METLKETKYYKDVLEGKHKNRNIICSQGISSYQIHLEEGNYYKESSVGLRGAAAKINSNPEILGVYTSPNKEHIKYGFMAIIKEKISNDLTAVNLLLEEMEKDEKVEKTALEMENIIEYLKNPNSFLEENEKKAL